jgi:hypothetical protein
LSKDNSDVDHEQPSPALASRRTEFAGVSGKGYGAFGITRFGSGARDLCMSRNVRSAFLGQRVCVTEPLRNAWLGDGQAWTYSTVKNRRDEGDSAVRKWAHSSPSHYAITGVGHFRTRLVTRTSKSVTETKLPGAYFQSLLGSASDSWVDHNNQFKVSEKAISSRCSYLEMPNHSRDNFVHLK